jgi:alcohol dehydrogenase YqhD (iron-dependent ADH family)
MQNFDFQIPTKIIFGENHISELHKQIEPTIKKILIVTDKSAGEKNGALNPILYQMKNHFTSDVVNGLSTQNRRRRS